MASQRFPKQSYHVGNLATGPGLAGGWLLAANQKAFNDAGHPQVAERLSKIYYDEIGAGVISQNHPYIVRQLLESQGIRLPPVHSPEFIAVRHFLDSAFDLPVYLLAISLVSREYLPELLGLNLAIEISGLGRVYLRLADELAYWGINPTLVNLHTTIDNTASGHSALAMQAIQIYLDSIAMREGKQAMQAQWRRISNGYCSLQTATQFF